MRNIQLVFTFFILTVILITSCKTEYSTQHFSFPPGSLPHEDDWDYTAVIIVSSSESPITKKSKKNVQIKVFDNKKNQFLNKKYDIVSASIYANVVWEEFENIRVKLFETGNEYAKDAYNKKLLLSGPFCVMDLKYGYEEKDKQFIEK